MRVRVLNGFGLARGGHARVGDVLELPDPIAREKLRAGFVAVVKDGPVPDPDHTIDFDEEAHLRFTARDPSPLEEREERRTRRRRRGSE